jgi:hypothetical protein
MRGRAARSGGQHGRWRATDKRLSNRGTVKKRVVEGKWIWRLSVDRGEGRRAGLTRAGGVRVIFGPYLTPIFGSSFTGYTNSHVLLERTWGRVSNLLNTKSAFPWDA